MPIGAQSGIRALPWPCPPPADFRQRCRALPSLDAQAFSREVRALASCGMQESQLHQLASALSGRRSGGLDLSPLEPLTLAIVGNGATDLLAEALAATGARYGFDLRIVQGLFGQTMQEALSPDSAINAARPEYVLPVVDYRALPVAPGPGDADGEDAAVAAACGWLNAVREGFRRHAGATVVVPTVPVPPEPLFGSLDAAVPGSLPRILERVNRGLADATAASGDLLLDVARLASTVGLESWFDAGFWNLGKLPFGPAFVPLYADAVVRTLAAARGKSRKCLVLDLDNTLWGGVIGDDGLDGIVLGNGSAKGEAFLAAQRFALALRGRGVVLAVSSKNQDEIARLPFRSHAEMLLKESDISVFQANWQDKASNLRLIAEQLNIGTDALVLLDDNPAERALVRREMPEVAVPEVPADPTDYPRLLAWAGYFDAVSHSREDAERGRYYEQNARRAELASSATDMDGYLASLDMEMTVSPFGPQGRSRIHQLINKTNQFNLTTKRHSEHQVEAFETDPQALTFQVRLRDSFGDNGMISVVIGVADSETLEIDTWLMSCRVLNRGVEIAVLGVLAAAARARGFSALRGIYTATAKNGLVRAHYQRLGFTRSGGDEVRSVWVLPLDGFADAAKHIRVVVKDTE